MCHVRASQCQPPEGCSRTRSNLAPRQAFLVIAESCWHEHFLILSRACCVDMQRSTTQVSNHRSHQPRNAQVAGYRHLRHLLCVLSSLVLLRREIAWRMKARCLHTAGSRLRKKVVSFQFRESNGMRKKPRGGHCAMWRNSQGLWGLAHHTVCAV